MIRALDRGLCPDADNTLTAMRLTRECFINDVIEPPRADAKLICFNLAAYAMRINMYIIQVPDSYGVRCLFNSYRISKKISFRLTIQKQRMEINMKRKILWTFMIELSTLCCIQATTTSFQENATMKRNARKNQGVGNFM